MIDIRTESRKQLKIELAKGKSGWMNGMKFDILGQRARYAR